VPGGRLTFREIAEAVGYASEAGARHAVYRSLAAIVRPEAEVLRRLMDERYETVSAALMRTIVSPPPKTEVAKIVTDEHGRPIEDRDAVTRAATALVKLDERRSKLFGLDAPRVSVRLSLDDINAEIARVKAELGITDDDEDDEQNAELRQPVIRGELVAGDSVKATATRLC